MLDFEISPFIIGDIDKDKKIREEWFKKIKVANKPISLTYVSGFSNWSAVYETKNISLEELNQMINERRFGYFVREKDNVIKLSRIENYD